MSAELVDPFATHEPERLKASDMCEDITARLQRSQYDDRTLYPQLMQYTLRSLSRAAADGSGQHADWARWLLEQLHHRAVTGVEFGEQEAEPAWSLDTSARESLIDQNLWPHPAPEHQERP
jgi:hypothetical protein